MKFDVKKVKIIVTVPVENSKEVRSAICDEGAGIIGNYTDCTISTKCIGTFKPLDDANPYIGEKNKLVFVCGFNNYLGINDEYDTVNKTMYFDNLEDVKQYANEIICFYSNNDPYVKYEIEKEFADTIATEQVLIPNAGHINSESGYDTFEDIVNYI